MSSVISSSPMSPSRTRGLSSATNTPITNASHPPTQRGPPPFIRRRHPGGGSTHDGWPPDRPGASPKPVVRDPPISGRSGRPGRSGLRRGRGPRLPPVSRPVSRSAHRRPSLPRRRGTWQRRPGPPPSGRPGGGGPREEPLPDDGSGDAGTVQVGGDPAQPERPSGAQDHA